MVARKDSPPVAAGPSASARRRAIYVATPGGTTARGGIGRMVDYFTRT
jgi:hypothetical protein